MSAPPRGQTSTTALLDALTRLSALVEPDQRAAVAELIGRLGENRFRILVVGEAKRGKSTLVNALLGRDLLPVGVLPVTSVSTTVGYGSPERLLVRYHDGRTTDAALSELGRLVDERANPANRLGVDSVRVLVDAPLVRDGVELVDTPGTGSVYDHTEVTRRALRTMDAAILVLSADPPLSASERDLLAEVSEAAVRTFVVVNKADQLTPDDVPVVVDFVRAEAAAVLGREPEVLVCSARPGLRARIGGGPDPGSGLPEVEQALIGYLSAERTTGLQQSVRRKAGQLIGRTLDALRIRLSLAAVQVDEADRRVGDFRSRVEVVRSRRADADDLIRLGTERLLAELNESAAEAETAIAGRVVGAVRQWADGPGAALSVARLRAEGRAYAVEQVRGAVECWRDDRQRALVEGLRRIEDRLLADLADDLAEVAAAAREALGVDLVAVSDRSRLVDNPDFAYQFAAPIGWSELLTESLVRWLAGRRRAVAELLDEADRLTGQQVGRVRADLQFRLTESGRDLARALRERFAASLEFLERVLAESVHDRGTVTGGADQLARSMGPRIQDLELLSAELAE